MPRPNRFSKYPHTAEYKLTIKKSVEAVRMGLQLTAKLLFNEAMRQCISPKQKAECQAKYDIAIEARLTS